MLSNNNVLIGWAAHGYMSEHTMEGELVLEARLPSPLISTYRAYKYNFTGNPVEPPVIKSVMLGIQSKTLQQTTEMYVSWNGATEVREWKFYKSNC